MKTVTGVTLWRRNRLSWPTRSPMRMFSSVPTRASNSAGATGLHSTPWRPSLVFSPSYGPTLSLGMDLTLKTTGDTWKPWVVEISWSSRASWCVPTQHAMPSYQASSLRAKAMTSSTRVTPQLSPASVCSAVNVTAQVVDAVVEGRVQPEMLAWTEGMDDWLQASQLHSSRRCSNRHRRPRHRGSWDSGFAKQPHPHPGRLGRRSDSLDQRPVASAPARRGAVSSVAISSA